MIIKEDMLSELDGAKERGDLLPEAEIHLREWIDGGFLPEWGVASIEELIRGGHWGELNDRFYKNLAFGTGGMRSRTRGKIITEIESEGPYAAVGSAYLNDFTLIKATVGLYRYSKKYVGIDHEPKLVIAHDVRHFSRHFCELAASVWGQLGGDAWVFDGPRSTPQLSYSVRELGATAGVVITASHNPPHDNGYKVYFEDGGQVVSPHAEGIIGEVNAVTLGELGEFYTIEKGWSVVGRELDKAYCEVVKGSVLDRGVIKEMKPKVVYTPIHGVGKVASVPVMKDLGIELVLVDEQMADDADFATVGSPNPENAEALRMGIDKADEAGVDIVIAADPDADRMGVAVRGASGEMEMLTGNMIGSMLAEYRISRLKEMGKLPVGGSAALIKTFVTTELQSEIGRMNGLKVINTLTGFKWIGEKLLDYEKKLREVVDYDSLGEEERREQLLKHSTYYVFGGEESYGYLADDRVRDKDGNAAAVQFCELAAYLKQEGKSFTEYLDDIYTKYGYFTEDLLSVVYEGATGARRIQRILSSYREHPPEQMGGERVVKMADFGREEFFDEDGKRIPVQDFYVLELSNGYRYAVRGSGTEPKIKFYLFAKEPVAGGLSEVKLKARACLKSLKAAIEEDASRRAGE